jgi:hypothetical protein
MGLIIKEIYDRVCSMPNVEVVKFPVFEYSLTRDCALVRFIPENDEILKRYMMQTYNTTEELIEKDIERISKMHKCVILDEADRFIKTYQINEPTANEKREVYSIRYAEILQEDLKR